jgi:hypothetical protein
MHRKAEMRQRGDLHAQRFMKVELVIKNSPVTCNRRSRSPCFAEADEAVE